MTEIALPRGSPCHIISFLSYQVQIKGAALAVNVVTQQIRNAVRKYRHLIYHPHHPREGARWLLCFTVPQQMSPGVNPMSGHSILSSVWLIVVTSLNAASHLVAEPDVSL